MYETELLMQSYGEELRAALSNAGVTGFTIEMRVNRGNVCGTVRTSNGKAIELPKVSTQNELAVWVNHAVLEVRQARGY